MDEKNSEVCSAALFSKFANLIVVAGKQEQMLMRYLGEDNRHVHLVWLGSVNNNVLTLHAGPDTKRYRMMRPIEEMRDLKARERAWRVEERGLPLAMTKLLPSEDEEKSLASKRKVVEHIVRVHGDAPFMKPETYRGAVRDASEIYGLDRKTVRKYYERYLFYGGHRFALADQNWEKGAPDVPRHGARRADGTLIESGRKTHAQKISPSSKLRRMQFPEYLRARLTAFVEREAHVPGATITGIVRRFLQSLRGHNRGADGKKQSFPVDPRRLPSEANTIKIARPVFKKEKARLAVLRNSERGRGYSAQIARGDLNVVDIDGTVADCFLRYGDSTIAINGVLKPTVLLAIDRSSRAILGWYVTYRSEDADSYLACVFSACTDKEDELARWGVSHLDGMVYGCPSTIFVDRGSGISIKVRDAIVEQMRQRLLMAEPGNAKGKGDVEQLMDLFQEGISDLPGVTHGEPVRGKGLEKDAARKRNRAKLKKAPTEATLTLEEFMRALLTAVSRYNLNADMRRLRNSFMLEANVPPVPKHMFLFNMALRAGDAAWELTEEMVIRRLAKPFECAAPGGFVTRDKRTFTSKELQDRAIEYEVLNNGRSMTIEGYELFTSKLHALWDDDGYFVELEATRPTLEKFGVAIPDIRDYIQMRDGADLALERDKNRMHPTVEQSVKRGGVSQTMQRRLEAVEGVKRTINSRVARKAAVAHTGAADTRAMIATVQGTPEAVLVQPQTAMLDTAYLLDDAQEIDIDF